MHFPRSLPRTGGGFKPPLDVDAPIAGHYDLPMAYHMEPRGTGEVELVRSEIRPCHARQQRRRV
ncbi:MAG: hypothetical protein HYV63_30205 [Candidatus Schekmanbacteria bacterium]|nr:hypothetical protein [Candidatus Schekmanbacteria bacterium]